MARGFSRGLVAWGLVVLLTGAVAGRRQGGVTGGRVEGGVATTFANLIAVQRGLLGLPPVPPSALRASARCKKAVAAGEVRDPGEGRGGGEWTCTILWTLPGRKELLRDSYDLRVTMDGCYTATEEAGEGRLGGATLVTQDGTTVANLLYVFDGCFDTT